ncbi:hypothetical protein A2303_07195 [Candidatus Falkowbacteria bacterium RIFOXYB2_FULL_47_14]|uniref:Bacterial Ig-like domain-containing protein n=1 Tax=Candidatus Falkowbacteria bacterium RIFOXYA2_FULL_47_19 TaxID=1797994 RepID=A0A1F5SGL3_9BACT|nr:MAG: hypothetical protein A2227_00940 [Candidatus Falkowbacteria bacterium RIFOXYA2_FULL_47_19]OGF34934.1 MAG: hypothetical protein A2468_06900 [Candidatus Falkowbacteria bacterium RIFOXYC2_FULL_46_15]OGF43649.1 MAG: hypothetical protein A2303_07195 [Candidatus Falkowbacteria bacterium RIFOXYB2_FULL_47_14]
MLRYGKYFIILIFLGLSLFLINPVEAADNSAGAVPPAPTLIGPDGFKKIGRAKPKITGLTKSGTAVYVYIDGVYNGKTDVLADDSGTADFAYDPFLNLSKGEHIVWAVAKDSQGNKSFISNTLKFSIELPFPAPTLFKPVVNSGTNFEKPYIVGLAKNDSRVKIFIDKKFFGEFDVKNHNSGTTDFAYLPFLPLTEGRHMVYSVSTDKEGKESAWSNIVYFTVERQKESSAPIVAAAESEFPDDSEKTNFGKVTEAAASEEIAEIKALINRDAENTDSTGAINEKEESQGRLNLNSIIFIVFLLAVISWIFWVNRELIKERREAVKSDPGD